jgi:coiled-coil domain-containing protein 63/114
VHRKLDEQSKLMQREIIEQKKRGGGSAGAVAVAQDHAMLLKKSLKQI